MNKLKIFISCLSIILVLIIAQFLFRTTYPLLGIGFLIIIIGVLIVIPYNKIFKNK